MRRAGGQRGLTLVELMVSMVVLGFAIAAAFGIAFALLNGFTDNKRVLEAEQSARASLDYIGDTIRSASPGVTEGALHDLADPECNDNVDAIVVENGVGVNGSDVLTVIHAAGGVVGFMDDASLDTADSVVNVNAGDPDFYDSLFFEKGDYVVITEGTTGHLFLLQGVDPSTGVTDPWELTIADPENPDDAMAVGDICSPGGLDSASGIPPYNPVTGTHTQGAMVIRARRSRFAICDINGVPYLIVGDPDGDCVVADDDFEPIAKGIEDLQVVVGIDVDGDEIIDGDPTSATSTDEWYFNHTSDASLPNTLGVAPHWDALQITVVARTTDEASDEAVASNVRPAVADNPASSTNDQYRRRTLSTILDLRNVQ